MICHLYCETNVSEQLLKLSAEHISFIMRKHISYNVEQQTNNFFHNNMRKLFRDIILDVDDAL